MIDTTASPSMAGNPNTRSTGSVFPLWLRISHWANAIGVVLMIMSGWRVYNASPIYPFVFPGPFTLGGWLGGALQWHFAAMWIIVVNGLFYLVANLVSRRLMTKFFPLSAKAIWSDFKAAMRGSLSHDDLRTYNGVQRAAYLFAIVDLIVLVLSGIVLWKNVQFPLLRELLGGYETARRIHFFAMVGMVSFVGVHVMMSILVPRTLLAMIRGR